MKHIAKIISSILLFIICTNSNAQMQDYGYKRELKGISEQWHKIILPDEIFAKTNSELSDIKIFGITENNDTIEAPYILQLESEKISISEVEFNLINQTRNARGHFFTFEVPLEKAINQINLEFDERNFDWKIKLEGSNDQKEWFTIIDDYRILSIYNSFTDYSFTRLNFTSSKFRYFRLMINNNKDLIKLSQAKISLYEIVEGNYRDFKIAKSNVSENKETNESIIELKLESEVAVSSIKINVVDSFDYYRPITIKYLTDSFKTENGWKYNYNYLYSGTLTSFEENKFMFTSTTLQNLKIVIQNYDNEALKFKDFEVKGNIHELIARFTKPAKYFLTYGNKNADYPYYDINYFRDNIPEELIAIEVGEEQIQTKENAKEPSPLFKNKNWLWAIMAIIILLISWFSIRMIRKK